MKIILLCAGFATRLEPISFTTPKHLLKVDGEIVIDRFLKHLNIDGEIILITNAKYCKQFEKWGKVKIYSDGVRDKEYRLGAVGDLLYIIDRLKIDEDILVCNPDHIVEGVDFKRLLGDTSATAITIEKDLKKVKAGSCLTLDNGFVNKFTEKPQEPDSNLYGLPYYFIKQRDLRYLRDIKELDNSGQIVKCLVKHSKIRGVLFEGKSKHITTKEDL